MEVKTEPRKILTDAQIDSFLVTKLGLAEWKQKIKISRLEFLKEFNLAYLTNRYYQNVSWSAVPKDQRVIPSPQEVLDYAEMDVGGTCIQLNYHVQLILNHLNYDTILIGMNSTVWNTPLCHMSVIVKFEKTSAHKYSHDLYLIDVGFGRPNVNLIPIHQLPWTGRAGGFDFTYQFNANLDRYERVIHGGDACRGRLLPDQENGIDWTFDLTPRMFDDFPECHEDIFSPRATSPYLDSLFLSRVTLVRSVDDYEYVVCRNVVLVEGTKETFRETKFVCYEAMLPVIRKYFPSLAADELTAAFAHYNRVREENLSKGVHWKKY